MEGARKTWELENAVRLVDPRRDALYSFDTAAQKSIRDAQPWKTDPNYFTSIRISAVALLKMVMHARSGGSIEVMGLMSGKIEDRTFVVTDAFRLPVEGTETRVNAHAEADEYMSAFDVKNREAGRPENVIGWYHSHPGYGCWLSGIDVNTQSTWQQYGDPFVAVVIDPDRTISAGKVEIGAFRCFPEGYAPPPDAAASEGGRGGGASSTAVGNAAIPMAKAADFGAHANRYYPLEVAHFKSGLDATMLEALWNKYWVQTLGSTPLATNRDYGTKQIEDLAGKLDQVRKKWRFAGGGGAVVPLLGKTGSFAAGPVMGGGGGSAGGGNKVKGGAAARSDVGKPDPALQKVVAAADKIAAEERTGLLAAEVKEKIFGRGQMRRPAPGGGDGGGVAPVAETEDVQMQMQDVK